MTDLGYNRINVVGDSLTLMNQNGPSLISGQLTALGWAPSDVFVTGVFGMQIWDPSGSPQNSTPQIIDAQRAAGKDSRVWCFALGTNDHFGQGQQSPWGFDWFRAAAIQNVIDKVNSGPRDDYIIYWIGLYYPNNSSRDPEAVANNNTLSIFASQNPGRFFWGDYRTHCLDTIASVPAATWNSWWVSLSGGSSTDVHNTDLGYQAFRAPFYGATLTPARPQSVTPSNAIRIPILPPPYQGAGWLDPTGNDPSASNTISVNDVWFQTTATAPPPSDLQLGPRGALALGTATYAVPTTGTVYFVDPVNGSDTASGSQAQPMRTIGHAISSLLSASGGTVVCRGGIYNESISTVNTTRAVTVQAYPGETVWMDGSIVVTSWTQSGSTWVHTGIPAQFSRANGSAGFVPSNYLGSDPNAGLPDQVFIDGAPLKQIADGATPATGQFSVNYSANTITIGNNPAGHEVRVTNLGAACTMSAPVSWKGIGFRRYSPAAFTTAALLFYGGSSGGQTIENCVFDYGASTYISPSTNTTIRRCTFTNSMYRAISAPNCDGLVIDSCVFQNNNRGLFATPPQTGVIKVSLTIGTLIVNNLLADNNGANGIWHDVTCLNPVVIHNRVKGNHNTGIQFEETSGDLVGGVRARGLCAGNWVSDAQIGLTSWVSAYIDFYNNTFDNCPTQDIFHAQDRSNGANGSALQPQENSRSGITSSAPLTFVGGVPTTTDRCPYWAISCTYANNVFSGGSGPLVPFRAIDKGLSNTSYSAVELDVKLLNNTFRKTGSSAQVQWGNTSGVSPWYDSFSSVATAQSTVGNPTHLSGNTQSATVSDSQALPLPADIAALLGVPAGTQHMGSWITE